MKNCNCKQCQDIKYSLAIVQTNKKLNMERVLKHYKNLHPIAQKVLTIGLLDNLKTGIIDHEIFKATI